MAGWHLEHTYAELPQIFYSKAAPTAVREPRLAVFNRPLATMLGLEPEALEGPEGAAIFAGNALPDGGRPIAQAYAGHQYGHFTALGDGRAILLGEQITPSGDRVDIQLKGAGQTRFSRRGDGRAALGPMLREYIISEAMHALGIPTTRSLAVAKTGEPVYRETVLDGAVLTRVAASHIRVGTMQWASAHNDREAVRALADYTRARHYPELADSAEPNILHGALFDAILARQAYLIARWQLVGFIHGVMNTDNMALSGETIDYGPCAFMDRYDPATVFSSIDHGGRYAYGNQPSIAQWNLARLAEAMLPLFDRDGDRAVERATAALDRFPDLFEQHWLDGMRAKLGLFTPEEGDKALVDDLLAWMQRRSADFTNTFRSLTRLRRCAASARQARGERPVEGATSGERRVEGATSGERRVEGATSGERRVEGATSGERPVEGATSGERRVEGATSGERPVEDATSVERLVEGATSADAEFEAWHDRWAARRGRQPQSPTDAADLMRRHNPAFIPRNHNVEKALQAATSADDYSVMERLLDVLATPHDHGRDLPMFSTPSSGEQPYRTFCGT